MQTFSRTLGHSELSYLLPSRADGVNDMYLHLGFRAPQRLVRPHRVAVAWAILRLRHPLLAAHVLMDPAEYDTARFVYTPPPSPAAALLAAQATLLLRDAPKDALIDAYLNGPRTLSNDRVAVLILAAAHPRVLDLPHGRTRVATPPPTPPPAATAFDPTAFDPTDGEFDLLFCAAHFLGDGIALHTCANDLFTLLAAPHSAAGHADASGSGDTTPLSDTALNSLLESEWSKRWGDPPACSPTSPLPPPLESRLPGPSTPGNLSPSPLSTFRRVAHDLAFRRAQARLIGGHAFARVRAISQRAPDAAHPTPAAPPRQCHTLVRTVAFPPSLTRRVLRRCRQEGVSVAHVLFALCNIAWGRVGNAAGSEMPMMMYSALNLRPYLTPAPAPSLSLRPGDASYWFLAVGYFNVVLPAFLLPPNGHDDDASDTAAHKTLFHRARLSKRQCASAAKTPFLAPYAQRMARERGERARAFARADDGLDSPGKGQTPGLQTANRSPPKPAQALLSPPTPPTTPTGTRASTPPPSTTVGDPPSLPEKLPGSIPESPPLNDTSSIADTSTPAATPSPKPPSSALLGLSLLGNLDAMYTHSAYTPLTLHTLTTGSRQRKGALLLFGYTFGDRLWVSLGWDGAAFGGEGRGEAQGGGERGEARGVVWEGLGDEGALGDKRRQVRGDGCASGAGMVGCEGELGRWWREVVRGVGEFFGEEE